MKIEDQICHINHAKKLHNLGIEIDSYFLYEYYGETAYTPINFKDQIYSGAEYYHAYTASELMEILPQRIDTKKDFPYNIFGFNLTKGVTCKDNQPVSNIMIETIYSANYHCETIEFSSGSPYFAYRLIKPNIYNTKLVDCLAELLIYLIENKWVDLNE